MANDDAFERIRIQTSSVEEPIQDALMKSQELLNHLMESRIEGAEQGWCVVFHSGPKFTHIQLLPMPLGPAE